MRILVVDDDLTKRDRIQAVIGGTNGELPHSVWVAEAMSDAVRLLNSHEFDLIVLDLMLPYLPGGHVDARAGVELVDQLRGRSGINHSSAVVGISAFPEEVENFRDRFQRAGVLITRFDSSSEWENVLVRAIRDVAARSSIVADLDFLIICALESERGGFGHTKFIKSSEAIVGGLNVHYGRIDGWFGAIVRLSGIGLVTATREATIALERYRVRVACMSGICAGFKGRAVLGQLIIASPAWEYQAGKWSGNGFEIAPEQVQLRPATRPILDLAVGATAFCNSLEANLPDSIIRPTTVSPAKLAPFVTGSAVIADESRLSHIEVQHRKVAALDMEVYGLYYAAHQCTRSVEHYFAVKAVVDLADGEKSDNLQPYGCLVSARATEHLIRTLLTSRG